MTGQGSRFALVAAFALCACGSTEEDAAMPLGAAELATGTRHTCALLLDGSVRCWGFDLYGQITPPSGRFLRITAGEDRSCGIREDGSLSFWGNPFREQNEAIIEPPQGKFVEVDLGYSHACALRDDGTPVCWADQQDPVRAATLTTAPNVALHGLSVGNAHACALDATDAIVCWGDPVNDHLAAPPGSYSQVAVGAAYSCALDHSGAVHCWGGPAPSRKAPPAGSFELLSAGDAIACAYDGTIRCWGEDFGYGLTDPPDKRVSALRVGVAHACGLDESKRVFCWGANLFGQSSVPK
jgi:alpha-tubulin suppressor-like RCC1 family protein